MEMKTTKQKVLTALWTIVRIYLGYQWISAGWEKITNPQWVGGQVPAGISGFLNGAVAKAGGAHPAVQGWYADFLKNFAVPNAGLFSYLVAFGEFAVGLGLILGTLTTIALIAGAFMNLNYLLAGTTSTNPNDFAIAMILLFAGAYAYTIGLDYFILPAWRKRFGKKTKIA